MIGDRTAIGTLVSAPGTIALISEARSGIGVRVVIPNSGSEPGVASGTAD